MKHPKDNLTTRLMTTGVTLSLGGAGSFAAIAVGIPAGAIVGSILLVGLAAALKSKVMVPKQVSWLCFTILGCVLGTAVNPDFLALLPGFAFSLLMMACAIGLSIVASYLLLRKIYALDAETAILAPLPGAISVAIELSDQGSGRADVIRTVQVFRLVSLTAFVPLALLLTGNTPPELATTEIPLPLTALLIAGGLIVGCALFKLRVPAAFFVAGFLIASLGAGTGIVTGDVNAYVFMLSLSGLGAFIGVRVALIPRAALGRLLPVALTTLGLTLTIAAATAAVTVAVSPSISYYQALIAYTPGGVEAMSAVGLALGLDPLFIAGHHLVRIILLLVLTPLLLRLTRQKRTGTSAQP